ncbi:MAG: hypothetical protein ABII00_03860 [Elusimicrobiota bacterium]
MHTLHDFFWLTEAVMYVLILAMLAGFVWFYYALTGGEEKENGS